MKRSGQWAVALVCVVLGFILSMQFKVQQRAVARDVGIERAQEAAGRVAQLEKEKTALQGDVTELRQRVDRLMRQESDTSAQAQRIQDLEMAAALIPVTGPGVVVVLEDSARPFRPGENPNAYILHDEDLLRVVNELQAAGAEAISLNGQRLTARSEIRCSGPTVTVNGVRTAPPVEVRAIGDGKMMEAALRIRGGVVEYLGLWGIKVQIIREQQIKVPGFTGTQPFQFAHPLKAQ